MAESYNKWYITQMQMNAQQAATNANNQISFKRIIASSDVYKQSDLQTLNNSAIETIKVNQTELVGMIKVDQNTVTVAANFTNTGLKYAYNMNTLFLIAEYNGSEYLAAATTAVTPWYMSEEKTDERVEYTFKVKIVISNTAIVNTTIDPNVTVLHEEFDDYKKYQDGRDAGQDDKIKDLEEADKNNVKTTGDQSVDGNKTFLQKIIGSITGTAGTAIKLLTGRNIQTNLSSTSAVKFDGSADVKPGVTGTLPVANGGTGTTTGNAPSASKLSPGRKINGVAFDGSKDINIIDPSAVHKTGDESIDGTKTFKQTIKQDMTKRSVSRLNLYTVTDDNYAGTVINMLAGDTYGRAVGFGSGGLTLIGGGEAAASYMDAIIAKNTPVGAPSTPGTESSVMVSDAGAYIISGYQNGGKTGQVWEFNTSGKLNKMINGTAVNVINASGVASSASKLATARTINGVAFDGTKNIAIADPNAVHKNAALSIKDYSATLFGVANAIQFHVTDTGVGVVVAGALNKVPTSDGSKKTGAQIPAGVPLPPYDVRLPWATWSGITNVTKRTGFIGFFLLKKGSRDIYYKQQTTREDSGVEYTPGTLGIDTSGWYPTH